MFTGDPSGAVRKNPNTSLNLQTRYIHPKQTHTGTRDSSSSAQNQNSRTAASSVVLSSPTIVLRSVSPGRTLSTQIPESPLSFVAVALPETQFGSHHITNRSAAQDQPARKAENVVRAGEIALSARRPRVSNVTDGHACAHQVLCQRLRGKG